MRRLLVMGIAVTVALALGIVAGFATPGNAAPSRSIVLRLGDTAFADQVRVACSYNHDLRENPRLFCAGEKATDLVVIWMKGSIRVVRCSQNCRKERNLLTATR